MSFCLLKAYPSFTLLFICIAKFGIIHTGLSKFTITSLGFSISSVFNTTLPAIPNGLSSHVLKIGPP